MTSRKSLIVTAGEPAGIGPDICLSLAHELLPCNVVVVADPDTLRARAAMIGTEVTVTEIDVLDAHTGEAKAGELLVIATRFPEAAECGRPDPANSRTLLDGLKLAVDACVMADSRVLSRRRCRRP